jgi:hypothetical protein
VAPGLDPADVCAHAWRSLFHAPTPSRLTECVVDGGGIGVFPYPASMDPQEACSSIGAALPDPADRTGG